MRRCLDWTFLSLSTFHQRCTIARGIKCKNLGSTQIPLRGEERSFFIFICLLWAGHLRMVRVYWMVEHSAADRIQIFHCAHVHTGSLYHCLSGGGVIYFTFSARKPSLHLLLFLFICSSFFYFNTHNTGFYLLSHYELHKEPLPCSSTTPACIYPYRSKQTVKTPCVCSPLTMKCAQLSLTLFRASISHWQYVNTPPQTPMQENHTDSSLPWPLWRSCHG